MDCWINLTVSVQDGLEVLFPVVDYSVDILDEMSVIFRAEWGNVPACRAIELSRCLEELSCLLLVCIYLWIS